MLLAKKIQLKPTGEQEVLFWKSAGVARWSFNFYIAEREAAYKQYVADGKNGKFGFREQDVRKYINNELKPKTHTWLKEVSSNVMKQAVKDADNAYKRFFKGLSDKPKFKVKYKSKTSFYVNYESLKAVDGGFKGERLGFVETAEPLPELKNGEHYSNPRITYDGKYWYLSVSYEVNTTEIDTTEIDKTPEVIGIDLGVKALASCSDKKEYKNINKTKTVKKLEKRLKRKQRSLSRMLLKNTDHYTTTDNGYQKPVYKRPLRECKNMQKMKKMISLIYKRLSDIRQNYIHQTTTEIVKKRPKRIVMEDLNIKGMMKNKHLSKAIQQQKLYEFIRQIKYKSMLCGIEFKQVPRFYPSSKTCSDCGNIKKDLKLKDRVYKCLVCGLKIDRDYNASLNLANFKFA